MTQFVIEPNLKLKMKKIIYIINIFLFTTVIFASKIFAIQVDVLTPKIIQGETMFIVIKPDEGRSINEINGMYINQKIKFIKKDEIFYAYLGIPLKVENGIYTLKINIKYTNNETEKFAKHYQIEKRKLTEEKFSVSNNKIKLFSNEIAKKEEKDIDEAISSVIFSSPLWQSKFILPLKGEITSPFGALRYINQVKSSYHYGIDIAAPLSGEIRASNDGIICKVADYILRGKTVIINHGAGVFTLYNHMAEVFVKNEDKVKAGDIIGKVGETGFVTGPHLHWELVVNDISVNPMTWVEVDFILK